MKAYTLFFQLITTLLLLSCSSNQDVLPEEVDFILTEFTTNKNGDVLIDVTEMLTPYTKGILLEVVTLPSNGTLNNFDNAYLQYRPSQDFIGLDLAVIRVVLASNPEIVLASNTIKFKVEDEPDQGDGTFFNKWPCNVLPVMDSKVYKYFFMAPGDVLSFNAFKDIICAEAIDNEGGRFEIELMSENTQYGIPLVKDQNTIIYKNESTDTDKIDKVVYRLYMPEFPGYYTTVTVYFLIGDPCMIGYTPVIDYYTMKVSEGQSLTLPVFGNDILCGLTVEEIKSRLTVNSFGTAEFPLDPHLITPIGSFDLSTLQYRTNVTTDYFNEFPNAYVRGNIWLEYRVSSTEVKRSIVQIRIIK